MLFLGLGLTAFPPESHMSVRWWIRQIIRFELTCDFIHVEVRITADSWLLTPSASPTIRFQFDHSLLPAVACNACSKLRNDLLCSNFRLHDVWSPDLLLALHLVLWCELEFLACSEEMRSLHLLVVVLSGIRSLELLHVHILSWHQLCVGRHLVILLQLYHKFLPIHLANNRWEKCATLLAISDHAFEFIDLLLR